MKFPRAHRTPRRPRTNKTRCHDVPLSAFWKAYKTQPHLRAHETRCHGLALSAFWRARTTLRPPRANNTGGRGTPFSAAWRAVCGPLLLFASFGAAAPISAPAFENEHLHYNINWPSGLSLGEAQLSATTSKSADDPAPRLHFSFDIDAGIPGFTVTDRYRSQASNEFCSAEFQRNSKHGAKALDEKMTFDAREGKVTRQAAGGAKTEVSTTPCAKDALAFLYYVRHELSQGRIPGPQTIFFGPQYEVHLEFAGTQTVQIGEKPVEADRVKASVQGPVAAVSFEIFFLKDPARTPVLVRVPLSMGTFSMELAE